MNQQLIYLDEPQVLFGYDQRAADPRDGLTLFGPYESFSSYSIQAGVIGTQKGIDLYRGFVTMLGKPLMSRNIQRPTYPGFQAIFNVEWAPTPTIKRVIDETAIESGLGKGSVKERTYRLVNLYLEEIKRARDEEESKVDIWFIVVPQKLWRRCRAKSEDKTQVDWQTLQKFKAGLRSFFPEINEEYEELSIAVEYDSDFHHQLKARLLQERIGIPIQIMLEPTLEFKDKYTDREYDDDMKAHIAWTQSSTVYYKLGKLPWKLADIRPGVCYIGMVFKRYEIGTQQGYACSAAQMFLDSGDGTVFRGNIGPWKSKSSKDFHLDKKSARELLSKAVSSYCGKVGEYPREVFIHGRAGFSAEEWDGFQQAVRDINPEVRLTGVVIKESDKLKLFRDVAGEDSKYGNLRGLAWILDGREAFLWTRGFVPRLNTSTSLEIPNPLRILIDKSDADIVQVSRDILALTKLNYNACLYGDGIPVTLRFSDLVGSILTAVDRIGDEVLPFKYYI